MFTSRAEYRLILREDNATIRLMGKGYELGLISQDHYGHLKDKVRQVKEGISRLSLIKIYPGAEVNATLHSLGTAAIKNPVTLYQLLKRYEIRYDDLKVFPGWESISDRTVKKQIEIEAKYEGYIKRQVESIEKMKTLDGKKIPKSMDYRSVPGLSNELKMKLTRVEPATIGQAERIPGMTQAALTAILVTMKKMELEASAATKNNTPSS
jgi:tRNA uridine 5-carboxymethylaminomethyl modification enzyme